jgi:hypothetical protein
MQHPFIKKPAEIAFVITSFLLTFCAACGQRISTPTNAPLEVSTFDPICLSTPFGSVDTVIETITVLAIDPAEPTTLYAGTVTVEYSKAWTVGRIGKY